MAGVDVLIYVEDPGAVNIAAGLPAALAARGARVLLCAAGPAGPALRRRGIRAVDVDGSSASDLLEGHSPRLVVVGTSEDPATLGLRLVDEARSRGLPTAGLVDAPSNAGHRFRGTGREPLGHAPDWLLVPDEPTRSAFVALGHPPGHVVVTGHPQAEAVLVQADRLAGVDREALRGKLFPGWHGQQVVLFLAETNTGLDPRQYRRSEAYTLAGRGGRDGRTDVVLEEFLDAVGALPSQPYLVLRPHPKNQPEDLAPYAAAFERVDGAADPLEQAFASDLVVGMTTSLLGEAALLGRPALAILPRPEERAWLPSFATEHMVTVTSRDALQRELRRLLEARGTSGNPAAMGSDPHPADRQAELLLHILG